MKKRFIVASLLLSAAAAVLHAQDTHLELAGKPRLINCDGNPCFRVEVNAVDAQGQPTPLDDNTVFGVTMDGRDVPIRAYVRFAPKRGAVAAPAARPRVTLVLFDTSGSMNQRLPGGGTKFTAARDQLERLYASLQEGVDQMAIAPFDSSRVADRIRAATFEKTKAGLRRQVDELAPRVRGNTALFSAVSEGLQRLKPFTTQDAQITLIVFTDGANDVDHPGDDPGLLSGPEGLRQVQALAQDVGVTIYTIGYGASGVAFDEPTLQALKFPRNASNYFNAQNESRLVQIFTTIARRGATTVTLLVGPLPMRREQLPVSVKFAVTAAGLSAESPSWDRNPLMTPPFEGIMTEAERAYVFRGPTGGVEGPPSGTGVPSYIMRLIVLVSYSVVIAGLWFGLPRLLWPERYIPKPAFRPAPARPQRPASPARPGVPPGRPSPPRAEPPRGSPRPPAHAAPPAGERPRPAPPGARPRETPPGLDRPRDNWGARDPGDATVFIPPSKKPGGPS